MKKSGLSVAFTGTSCNACSVATDSEMGDELGGKRDGMKWSGFASARGGWNRKEVQ